MAEHPKKPEAVAPPWTEPSDEQTNPRIKMSNMRTRLFAVLFSGGFSVVGLGSLAYAMDHLEQKATDAGTTAAKVEVAPVAAELKGHEARIQVLEQTSKQTQQDVHEARGELRDLYKAVMEGKRSERLETPLPPLDGGR